MAFGAINRPVGAHSFFDTIKFSTNCPPLFGDLEMVICGTRRGLPPLGPDGGNEDSRSGDVSTRKPPLGAL